MNTLLKLMKRGAKIKAFILTNSLGGHLQRDAPRLYHKRKIRANWLQRLAIPGLQQKEVLRGGAKLKKALI